MCLEDPDQVTGPHENFLLNHLKMENPDKLKRYVKGQYKDTVLPMAIIHYKGSL